MDSIHKLFDNDTVKFASKALDYLDDNILPHVVEMLDDPSSGRAQWRSDGMIALYRNITKNIIEKSAMLYKDNVPTLEVVSQTDVLDDNATIRLNDLLDDVYFDEWMINFDKSLRILKTCMIMTQYNDTTGKIGLHILHRGNSIVYHNSFTNQITQLIIKTGSDAKTRYFRVISPTEIIDYSEDKAPGSIVKHIETNVNPYGEVPVSVFYDTALPMTGFWVEAPKDLVIFNDAYNMHLCDSNYAAYWSVHQTLFTNVPIIPGEDDKPGAIAGGPGKVVELDTSMSDNTIFEYTGPKIDLSMAQDFFRNWSKDVANDWAVTFKGEGSTQPASGFSLVVREKDNLELRQLRAKFQANGLERFYLILKKVYNTHNPSAFSDDSKLLVTFMSPVLPFDEEKWEKVWTERILAGKASLIDYLMEKHGIDRPDAELKLEEIRKSTINPDGESINNSNEEI